MMHLQVEDLDVGYGIEEGRITASGDTAHADGQALSGLVSV